MVKRSNTAAATQARMAAAAHQRAHNPDTLGHALRTIRAAVAADLVTTDQVITEITAA